MGEQMKDVNFSKSEATEPIKIIDIQHACCPKGCDLMSEEVKIRGMKSITVKVKSKDNEGLLYLDPEFGKYAHQSDFDIPKGEIVEFYCPHCGVSLEDESEKCSICASPVFTLEIPKEGMITGCLKKGCFGHTLKIESFDAMHLQVDDDFIRVVM